MASADFWPSIRHLSATIARGRCQISPGIAHPPSRLCASDLRRCLPYTYRALHLLACLPRNAASIRFLFVAPALCFRLPSDPQSPRTPLPSANTSPCRVCRGLAPPSECALPGAPKKRPALGWPFCCVERVAYAVRRRLRPRPTRPRPNRASVPGSGTCPVTTRILAVIADA